MKRRFTGVVIGAKDVPALAHFYESVFGLRPLSEETVQGDPQGSLRLELPGFPDPAPTFLFLPADPAADKGPKHAGDYGYTHLCFETTRMTVLREAILKNGGTLLSRFEAPEKELTLYFRDPEENILEIHVPIPGEGSLAGTLAAVLRVKTGSGAKGNPKIRFLHVNIVTPDWEQSSGFYEKAFGGTQLGKLRNYENGEISPLVGMTEPATIVGRHITLPTEAEYASTLEIFTYTTPSDRHPAEWNEPGILALTFEGDADAYAELLSAGARELPEENGWKLLADPDGNRIIWR